MMGFALGVYMLGWTRGLGDREGQMKPDRPRVDRHFVGWWGFTFIRVFRISCMYLQFSIIKSFKKDARNNQPTAMCRLNSEPALYNNRNEKMLETTHGLPVSRPHVRGWDVTTVLQVTSWTS